MIEKLFYKDPYMEVFDAVVISCDVYGDKYNVVLNRTAFYPEGGGQPSDTGTLSYSAESGQEIFSSVSDVHEKNGLIIHTCGIPLEPGKSVHGKIDMTRRFDHMQQHSGEHIISGMICSAFDCDNVGFHMGEEAVTIDYNAQISYEDILAIEARANRYIYENHEFVELWPDEEELKKLDYRSKKELTGAVRITSFPGADMCACCGTHVRRSGEVGLIKVLSCVSFRGGVRIEIVCGERALKYFGDIFEQNRSVSRLLSARPSETAVAVERLKDEVLSLKEKLSVYETELFARIAEEHCGEENPLIFMDDMEPDSVRKLAEAVSEKASGCTSVFAGKDGEGYKYAVINKNSDIREMIKGMNCALDGRGGGRDGFAQGRVSADRELIRDFMKKGLQ